MASQSTDEISLSDSEGESEPENKGKISDVNDKPSVSFENLPGDNETKENEDKEEEETKPEEEGEAEASVYTEQDLTEEGKRRDKFANYLY